MKLLSIEEKAKRYDEAIKEAVIVHKDEDKHLKATLERIFPELNESEDERIRKELLEHCKNQAKPYIQTGNKCPQIQSWIDWLEKKGYEPNWCHHKVDLSNCSEEYRKAYYDGWNNCNMQHSQCNSEKNDVIKCLINGMRFYYEDNEDATWGTEKFQMKVKDILSWLENQGQVKESINSQHENKTCKGNDEFLTSEDERIRKALIDFFNRGAENGEQTNGVYDKDILAWLEKQDPCHTCDHPVLSCNDFPCEKKQGAQNPNDKVEPKFKVGDWVTGAYNVFKIISLNDELNCYIAVTPNNEEVKIPYYFDDGQGHMCSYHLWTIEDAKPGDVLVCPKYAGDTIPNIFIFKDIKTKDNDVFCYCSFLETFRTEGYIANADSVNTDFYPATKEQRDLLFKKMKEAGYEWNIDKREVEKIKQNPAWSEEDELTLLSIIQSLNLTNEAAQIKIDWLKSLKDRYTWLPSDEQILLTFADMIVGILVILKTI